MRLLSLVAAIATMCIARPAVAQKAHSSSSKPVRKEQQRIALSTRTRENATARAPMRLACAPISGKVFNPNGQPLVGATLLIKGTQQVYATDSEGKFLFTESVYEGQVLAIEAAGYTTREIALTDCALPRLVLERSASARIRRTGKRAGQVVRLNSRNTNLR